MENILKRLDINHKKHLYHQLYKIRSEYIGNSANVAKLTELNGIKKLVELLPKLLDDPDSQNSQNEKIIEVILSILGNCTFNNEKTANQAFENNISEIIISIVNSNNENNSIMTKACRLIGNLAQFQKIALNLQSRGLALSVSNLLSEEANRSVLTMAIRIIRLMWKSKRFRFEIISLGSLHKIMIILHQVLKCECDNSQEPEIDSDVIILKRRNEPDRTISREKLGFMIEKMDKHEVEVTYEIQKPPKKKIVELQFPKDKESLDLIFGITKCIHTLTTSSSSQVARSVYSDGFGIESLIFLSNENSKHRSMSLNILSNLSSNTLAQEYLAINNDLVDNVANLLLNSDNLNIPLDESEKKFCLNILCFSSENACNRGKLRRSGVFKPFLKIAHSTTCEKELALLIFTFYQFRFDQLGLDTLLELGFINVMIKILSDLIENKEVDHIKFDDPSLDDERKEEQKQKQKKRSATETIGSYTKYVRYDPGSPSGSSGGFTNIQQLSPSIASGYSPFNSPCRYFDCEDSNSENYSPVCSDNEEDDDEKKQEDFNILTFIYENNEVGKEEDNNVNENLVLHDENSNTSTTNENENVNSETMKICENIPETLKQIKKDPINFVLHLLWQVSISNSDSLEFVRPNNLLTLHKVCKLVPKPNGKISKILENILTQTRNFVAILKQNFVIKIHDLSVALYDHKDCYSCSKMKIISRDLLKSYGTVAESGYGRGEFAHFLLTGDDELKKKVAVNLIYIISCPMILNDMLFRFKALDLVFDVIFNEQILASEACDGVTSLSRNLNIQTPSEDELFKKLIPEDFIYDENLVESGNSEKVKFLLKDGEISFDRNTMKSSSEVFNSMLSSEFRENKENEIKFPDYTMESMKYFCQVLKMNENRKLKIIAPRVNNIDMILNSYELSILYIINDIQKPLLNVIKTIMDETNVLKVFEWSLRNINQELLISAMCYFLSGRIEGKKKLKLYLEANKSQFSKEWKELVIDTISMKCQPSM